MSRKTHLRARWIAGISIKSGDRRVGKRIREMAAACGLAVLAVLIGVLGGCSVDHGQALIAENGRVQISDERPLMGTLFRIDVVVGDETVGWAAIEAAFTEVERAESLLSNWDESSQISKLNRAAAGQPYEVSDELFAVLDRAQQISKLTQGAFDITFAACGGLWSIRDRRIPSEDALTACLAHVDYRRVALDRRLSAVVKTGPEVMIGIAGLAKGYRIDRAADVLKSRGITDYVVDGGGDMRVSTSTLEGSWPITVAHPRLGEPLGTVDVGSGAIATSGDYEWFFERDGVRYHHILDPSTGRPARKCTSATVIATSAVEADALATGLFVMGPHEGLDLAERLPDVEALLIAPDLSVHTTSGFPPVVVLGTSKL